MKSAVRESVQPFFFRRKSMDQLKLYQIDMKYVRNLHNADDRVESVSPQIGKANRVFIGVVVVNDDKQFCIPLSHPKEKHKNMSNNSEIHKIIVDGKLIGVLNFNLMIPVTEKQLIPVDLLVHGNDTPAMKAWKNLCINELKWCRKPENERIIRCKAKNLYKICTYKEENKNEFKGKKRCVDFKKLEEVCERYNQKHNSKDKLENESEKPPRGKVSIKEKIAQNKGRVVCSNKSMSIKRKRGDDPR